MSYNVLAINPGHNGSVALVKDGVLDFYLEEERLSRHKYDGNPFRGILEAVERCEIHALVLGGTSSENLPKLTWTGEEPHLALVRKFYPNVTFYNCGDNHHLGHAAGAFFNSGFDTAVAVVVDGAGSYHNTRVNDEENAPEVGGFECESIILCKEDITFQPLYKSYGSNKSFRFSGNIRGVDYLFDDATTITKVYEAVSDYLGFGFIEAGKTMGLAPYGKYDDQILDLFVDGRANKNLVIPYYPAGAFIDHGRRTYLAPPKNKKEWHNNSDLVTSQMKNIAWTVQQQTQKLVGDLVEKAIDMSGLNKVVIAGGYGLNCVCNYYLKQRFPNVEIFVDPVSHDGGTSIGLAKLIYTHHCKQNDIPAFAEKLHTLYLGPSRFDQISEVSEDDEFSVKDVSYSDVAELISNQNIVSLFQSRSEAGPRALGNRSILFDPRAEDGKDKVNVVKGREWFRPFAGSVLAEEVHEWFDLAGMDESPHMMYAVNVRGSKLGDVPAITHVDGTCRIQTVTEGQNEHYYKLIKAFKELTGCPILFNTSFNLAGDPLVETIDDALNTLRKSGIQYMYLPEVGKLVCKK